MNWQEKGGRERGQDWKGHEKSFWGRANAIITGYMEAFKGAELSVILLCVVLPQIIVVPQQSHAGLRLGTHCLGVT